MFQKIDLSGVHRFWEIVDIFERGDEPDEEKWSELFNTPGYEILTQIEFSEEFFKQIFGEAYGQKEINKKSEGEEKIVEHFKDVKDNREQLNRFLGDIFTQDYYEEALDLAFEWLPFDEREPYPPVSFLFFQKDARGYIPIVFDLQFAYELEENLSKFLAHEIHHFYRNMEVSFDPSIEDKEIVWALNQIHMEGMADHINKDLIIGDKQVFGQEYQELYTENYQDAEHYIKELDTYIKKYSEDPDEYGKKIQDTLPLSGHPIGFFMTETIINSDRKEEMIDGYDEPFSFFKLYNVSAEEQDKVKLSKDSLKVIDALKEKYT
ncbi:MAG: DUF5700 domain-containing putative Zn-dependent protease [Thermoplasmata archaeon]